MRIKLTVSYDGTNYCGWQRQSDKPSIQQTIEEAIKQVTNEEVKVCGSGRTDSGVHALGQVCHFDTNSTIPAEKFFIALNIVLPNDIKVIKSEKADDNFNACRSAKKKTYSYTFYTGQTVLPLLERYATKIDGSVDVELMKQASALLVGEHDFKCFCASGGSTLTTVRTLYSIDVISYDNIIKITVCGNGFLYNMVRIIAGTLLAVGQKRISIENVKEMLNTGKRELGGRTIASKGLCLEKVEYMN